MNTIEVLVATMRRESLSFLEAMGIQTDALIVNQIGTPAELVRSMGDCTVRMVPSAATGVSRSRNTALKNATGEICHFADDDLVYENGYARKIIQAYAEIPNADIIVFQVARVGGRSKPFPPKRAKVNFFTSMRVSSVEITFRRTSVLASHVSFDDRFGAGSQYGSGEETLFLQDCLRKGLKIYYQPVQIATVDTRNSTWFKGYGEEYLQDKGALFQRMSRVLAQPLIALFAIRKRRLHRMPILEAIQHLRRGAALYKELQS